MASCTRTAAPPFRHRGWPWTDRAASRATGWQSEQLRVSGTEMKLSIDQFADAISAIVLDNHTCISKLDVCVNLASYTILLAEKAVNAHQPSVAANWQIRTLKGNYSEIRN